MKSRIFLFFAIVSVAGMLAMSGCHRDDDEQNGRNGRNGRTTGTLSGHDYVDLGLPSGTKWATCNVGANSPEEYGDYFAWGEIAPKDTYTMTNYRYGTYDLAGYVQLYKYNTYDRYGQVDNLTSLEASDDAAIANWGSGWRMPTKDEFKELETYCTRTWTTQNLVPGSLFTGPNGNSIFLPAAGRYDGSALAGLGSCGLYWSSLLSYYSREDSCEAEDFIFTSNECTTSNGIGSMRWLGYSIRPVCNR
ncbi:MAG: hypothetical protein IKO34_03430 [Bacteroidales bacterium]|nr:hypothetical protein [Bacteroidales bacterium]MBR4582845.1 hypothetical protein [Bacteroidales bacterium]